MIEVIIFTAISIVSYIYLGYIFTNSGLKFFSHRLKFLSTLSEIEQNSEELMQEKYIRYLDKNGISYTTFDEIAYSIAVTLFMPIWYYTVINNGYEYTE